MKKQTLRMMSFLGLALMFFFAIGCQKENVLVTESSDLKEVNPQLAYLSANDPTNDVFLEDGMLSFLSMDHFLETKLHLEGLTEEWENAFISQHADLGDEELNTLEEETGFNDEQPLEDFENAREFTSLRKSILEAEAVWLDNDVLDFDLDPDNHFIIEESTRTFLNVYGEVKIGSSIFVFREEATLEILNGNLEVRDLIRLMEDVSEIELADVQYAQGSDGSQIRRRHGGSGGTGSGGVDCHPHSLKRKSDKKTSGKRRIKWVISIWTHPWGCGPIAKTKSYKKKRRRGWKKYRTHISARVYGDMVVNTSTCAKNYVDASKSKRAKKVKTRRPGSACKAESGDIKGVHTGSGIVHHSVLTF